MESLNVQLCSLFMQTGLLYGVFQSGNSSVCKFIVLSFESLLVGKSAITYNLPCVQTFLVLKCTCTMFTVTHIFTVLNI